MVGFMLAGRLEAAEYALTPYAEPWGRSEDSIMPGRPKQIGPRFCLAAVCSILPR
jgi:hypothetical protein